MIAWCLFEQSGTFKNEFKKLGFKNAFDCDIANDFGETDFELDLFKEIEYEFEKIKIWQDYNFNKKVSYNEFLKNKDDYLVRCRDTIFDKMNAGDLIFAFFPCIRFTEKNFLNARCESFFTKNISELKKVRYSKQIVNETTFNYNRLCELVEIALCKDLKLIIENPNAVLQFLKLYFPFKPTITIENRASYGGDYYKKPTNFWFFNANPKYNFIFENIENAEPKAVEHKQHDIIYKDGKKTRRILSGKERKENQVQKSMISPKFANRFIREFIL